MNFDRTRTRLKSAYHRAASIVATVVAAVLTLTVLFAVPGTADAAGPPGTTAAQFARTRPPALVIGDAVAAIDLGTLTVAEKARPPLPRHSCPMNRAPTGSVVWIGYGCEPAPGRATMLAADWAG